MDKWDEKLSERGEDCAIEDILYKGYAHGGLSKEVVEEYLNYLTPQKCYIVHRDKAYAEKYKDDLQLEPIYKSFYRVEKIAEEKLNEWSEAMPRPGEDLDHPARNLFVPLRRP